MTTDDFDIAEQQADESADAIGSYIARKCLEARELEAQARDAWRAAQSASDRAPRLRAQGRRIPPPAAVESREGVATDG